ncbi:hypothetical protein NL676_034354 [Syzygium grande]|nr:hypothetical protein NL676_034354 [Syzygium grande]
MLPSVDRGEQGNKSDGHGRKKKGRKWAGTGPVSAGRGKEEEEKEKGMGWARVEEKKKRKRSGLGPEGEKRKKKRGVGREGGPREEEKKKQVERGGPREGRKGTGREVYSPNSKPRRRGTTIDHRWTVEPAAAFPERRRSTFTEAVQWLRWREGEWVDEGECRCKALPTA